MKNIVNMNVVVCLFTLTSLAPCFSTSGTTAGDWSTGDVAFGFSAAGIMGNAMVFSYQQASGGVPYTMALTRGTYDTEALQRIQARADRLVQETYGTGALNLTHGFSHIKSKTFIVGLNLWSGEEVLDPLYKLNTMVVAMPLLFSQCLNECFEEQGTRELSVFCMQAVIAAFTQKAVEVLTSDEYHRLVSQTRVVDCDYFATTKPVAFLSIKPIHSGGIVTTINRIGVLPVLPVEKISMVVGRVNYRLSAAFNKGRIETSFVSEHDDIKQVHYKLLDSPLAGVKALDLEGLSHLLIAQVLAECLVADRFTKPLYFVPTIQRAIIEAMNAYKESIYGPAGCGRRASGGAGATTAGT